MDTSKQQILGKSRTEWEAAVGAFIIRFGEIENVTYLALYHLLRDNLFKSTSSLGFHKRVEVVIDLIEGRTDVPRDLANAFAKKLKSARKLADTRNLIAHSPLMLLFFENPDEGWASHSVGLASVRSRDKAISMLQLQDATSRADELSHDLHNLLDEIYQQTGV